MAFADFWDSWRDHDDRPDILYSRSPPSSGGFVFAKHESDGGYEDDRVDSGYSIEFGRNGGYDDGQTKQSSLDVVRVPSHIPPADIRPAISAPLASPAPLSAQKRAHRQRRKNPSCDRCRERRVKCDATDISSCSSCSRHGVKCQFTKETNRRMSSIKYMQDLEKQLSSTKRENRGLREMLESCDMPAPKLERRRSWPSAPSQVYCDLCKVQPRSAKDLSRHVPDSAAHEPSKGFLTDPHRCVFCDSSFSEGDELSRHEHLQHGHERLTVHSTSGGSTAELSDSKLEADRPMREQRISTPAAPTEEPHGMLIDGLWRCIEDLQDGVHDLLAFTGCQVGVTSNHASPENDIATPDPRGQLLHSRRCSVSHVQSEISLATAQAIREPRVSTATAGYVSVTYDDSAGNQSGDSLSFQHTSDPAQASRTKRRQDSDAPDEGSKGGEDQVKRRCHSKEHSNTGQERKLHCIYRHRWPEHFSQHRLTFPYISRLRDHLRSDEHKFYTCKRCFFRYSTKNELKQHESNLNQPMQNQLQSSLAPCWKSCTDPGCLRYIHPHTADGFDSTPCVCLTSQEQLYQELCARLTDRDRFCNTEHQTNSDHAAEIVPSSHGATVSPTLGSHESAASIDLMDFGAPATNILEHFDFDSFLTENQSPVLVQSVRDAHDSNTGNNLSSVPPQRPATTVTPFAASSTPLASSSISTRALSNQDTGLPAPISRATRPHLTVGLQDELQMLEGFSAALSHSEELIALPSIRTSVQAVHERIQDLQRLTDARQDLKALQDTLRELRPQLALAQQRVAQPSGRERELESMIISRDCAINVLWGELEHAGGADDRLRRMVNNLAPNVLRTPNCERLQDAARDSCTLPAATVEPPSLVANGKQPDWDRPRADSAYDSR